ncbi:uncharacterized protein LOC144508344 [Mustelus asterias]
MQLMLTKLKEFSSKANRFADGRGRSSQAGLCKAQSSPGIDWKPQGKRQTIDMEKALEWLKWELTEMRFQNQTMVKQLLELHNGIQELKKEYNCDHDLLALESDSEDSEDGDSLNRSQPNPRQLAQRQSRRNSVP